MCVSEQTALHRAANSTSRSETADILGCTKHLVENGASLDVQDGAGMTPLEVAEQSNNLDVAAYLRKMLGAHTPVRECVNSFQLMLSIKDEKTKEEESRKRSECLQR